MAISSLLIFNPIMNLKEIILDGASDAESNCIVDSVESDGLYNPTTRALYESTSNVDNIFLNDYYAPTYFKNLRTNFGYNTKNSCGYVATAMLLSFWDTYWDDNIISENYDANSLLTSDCFDFSADSPGVEMEPYSIANVSDSVYHSNVFTYSINIFNFYLFLWVIVYMEQALDRMVWYTTIILTCLTITFIHTKAIVQLRFK